MPLPAVTVAEFFTTAGAAFGAAGAVALLLGVFYNRGLLPNVREDIRQDIRQDIAPLVADVEAARDAAQEAARQLTVNGHSSEKNTIKDDVSDLSKTVNRLAGLLEAVNVRLERLETLQVENRAELVQHLRWSSEIVPQLREEIEQKADKG